MDVARVSRYALSVQVQGGRFERNTERSGRKRAISVFPASFYAYVLTKDFRNDKRDEKYDQYEMSLLASFCSRNAELQQN